jgi:hypothetical protein
MKGRFLLDPDAGRMTIQTPDGRTPFNTDDGLLLNLATFQGQVSIGPLTAGDGAGFNRTDDYNIGNCNPLCRAIVGGMKFTLGDQVGGAPYDRWTIVFGNSSVVWLLDGHGPTGHSPDPNLAWPYQMIYYNFVIEDGVVKLRRRAFCSKSSQGTYTVKSHRITYKLKVGVFL